MQINFDNLIVSIARYARIRFGVVANGSIVGDVPLFVGPAVTVGLIVKEFQDLGLGFLGNDSGG